MRQASARENLAREARDGALRDDARILLSGDVMFDASLYFAKRATPPNITLLDSGKNFAPNHTLLWDEFQKMLPSLAESSAAKLDSGILKLDSSARQNTPSNATPPRFAIATLHRNTNTDDTKKLLEILESLAQISRQMPILFPLHPRTARALAELESSADLDSASMDSASPDSSLRAKLARIKECAIFFCAPLSYFGMLFCLQRAACVMSDSGGLQKEAYFFGKPHITLRENSEYTELASTHTLANTQEPILAAFARVASEISAQVDSKDLDSSLPESSLVDSSDADSSAHTAKPRATPFGDGNACDIIARAIWELYERKGAKMNARESANAANAENAENADNSANANKSRAQSKPTSAKRPRFGLIGVGGYIAPRHLKAIKEVGGTLICALDISDSVGILDSYFPEAAFFTQEAEFVAFLDALSERGERLDFISICTPNFLHKRHIAIALNHGTSAICEKPLVLDMHSFDELKALESAAQRRAERAKISERAKHTKIDSVDLIDSRAFSKPQVFGILQLRLHESIIALKQRIAHELAQNPRQTYQLRLRYITPRGRWYGASWKGDARKSGGIVCNIGVHLFDMLLFVFGEFARNEMRGASETRASGVLELANARVEWLLSVEGDDLAAHRAEDTQGAESRESSVQNMREIDSNAKDFASTSKSANFACTDSHQPPAKKALRILESIPQDSAFLDSSTESTLAKSAPKAHNAQDKAPKPPSTTPHGASEPYPLNTTPCDMGEPLSFDFSQGFEDLHTKSYQEILAGRGFGLDDIRACIALIEHISNQINRPNPN